MSWVGFGLSTDLLRPPQETGGEATSTKKVEYKQINKFHQSCLIKTKFPIHDFSIHVFITS